MRSVLFITTMLAGVWCISLVPVKAVAQPMPVVADCKESVSCRWGSWLATTLLPTLCISSTLRVLSARLWLLPSSGLQLLRAGLSGVPLLSALRLLPALLRSLL